MELDKFALRFGKIVINLKSLEFLARVMLTNKFGSVTFPKRVDTYEVDEKIEKCYLTDAINLRNVLEKFKSEFDFSIDINRICLLRNAIAHGRLSTFVKNGAIHMFNTKPFDEKSVKIVWNAILDESWFEKENGYVRNIIDRMAKLNQNDKIGENS